MSLRPSVRPSVRSYVRPLALRKNRRGTHLIARPGLLSLLLILGCCKNGMVWGT